MKLGSYFSVPPYQDLGSSAMEQPCGTEPVSRVVDDFGDNGSETV